MPVQSDRAATPADYRLLEVQVGVSSAELDKAYKRLARKVHPDAMPGADEATLKSAARRFQQLQQAYWAIRDLPITVVSHSAAGAAGAGAGVVLQYRHRQQRRFVPARPSGPPRVAAMRSGESLWVEMKSLWVSADRTCYLDPGAEGSTFQTQDKKLHVFNFDDEFAVELPRLGSYRWPISSSARNGQMVMWLALDGKDVADGLLPMDFLGSTVGDTPIGARRFASASALRVDKQHHVWLNLSESAGNMPEITTPVRVELYEDGYHITSDIPLQRWQSSSNGNGNPPGKWEPVSLAMLGGAVVRQNV